MLGAPRLPISLDPLIAEAKRRARRRRLLVALVVFAAIAAGSILATRGPGSGPPRGAGALSGAGRAGSVRLDSAGAIGPLQMNRSSRAQVIAWAGKPDVERLARHFGARPYDVLGYDCTPGAGTEKYWDEYPVQCQTAFYIVGGRLSLFFTLDPRFANGHGVRVGTPTNQAEAIFHRKVVVGCTDAIHFGGPTRFTVAIAGRGAGHVGGFYLHGTRDPGVTECD